MDPSERSGEPDDRSASVSIDLTRRTTLLGTLALFVAACGGGGDSAGSPGPVPSPPGPPAPGGARFPLAVQPGKRHLVEASGAPFLIHGDSAWSLIAELKREDVDVYLDDRAARGFNTLLVNLIEHQFASNAPANFYGDAPFAGNNDFARPNESYFAHADWVLQRCRAKGFLVLLCPAYLGYNGQGEGWYQTMGSNGTTKMRGYGRYVGQRYASSAYDHILWVHGGDFSPPNKALTNEVAAGIREYDSRLCTAHCSPEDSPADYWAGEPWLQVNNVYSYGNVYARTVAQYGRANPMPFFLMESGYEDEAPGNFADAHQVRQQAYQALLCGASGQLYGNNPIWHFTGPGLANPPTTWQQALGSAAARSMQHLLAVYGAPREWWRLQPDNANAFLTSGLSSGPDRAVASKADNGSYALAYLPSVRTVSINLGQLAGPRVAASWFDPATGATAAIAGSPFNATGAQTFRPAGNNGSGDADWVLVLESVA